jgi:hypothetical protein
MAIRCKHCRQPVGPTTTDAKCSCGWAMDRDCEPHHRDLCPRSGRDDWVGIVDF